MSRRVAVRGPLYAGKTTMAHALEREGFVLINFTDSLKAMAADALCHLGVPTSVADIKADKEHYRPFLQQLGTLVGFDEGRTIPAFVAEHIQRYGEDRDYVFDNVRFLAQWEALKPFGFTLVQLHLTPMQQEERATTLGISHEALGRAMSHPAEVGFPRQPGEVVLPGTMPVDRNVAYLLQALEALEEVA